MKFFRKIGTQDKDLAQVQSNIEQVINPLSALPLLNGVFLRGVNVSATPKEIAHTLGRLPQGWFLVDLTFETTVFRRTWTTTTITLQSGSACVVDLWVF